MSQARRARLCTAGKITQRNTDARFYTRLEDGTSPKKNFFIYYELDDEEVNVPVHHNWYNGEDDGSWVLIEPAEGPKCGWPEWQLCGGCGRVKGQRG